MAEPQQNWEVLFKKLDTLRDLLSYLVAVEHDTIEKKALVLTSMGLQPLEIARICGTSPHTISVRLTEAKRKKKK